MESPRPEVRIVNVVATAKLNHGLDLEAISQAFPTAQYRPEQFPGAVYRMGEPRVVILIFANGKLVVTGAKREEDVYTAVDKLQRRLEGEGLIFYGEAPRRQGGGLEVGKRRG